MSDGIIAYGLAGNFCEKCGRAKINRLLYRVPSGCATCDSYDARSDARQLTSRVITRHRCTKRPGIEGMAPGESWECPDCGSVWTVTEVEDSCDECGRGELVRGWSVVIGDRMDTAPKYERYVPVVMRNRLRPG